MTNPVRLTQLAKRAGCAAKQPPGYLLSLLQSLPPITDPNVLVGSATADDAAVYKLTDDLALVLTTDFFTPIVDRPYDFGAVAAANALSDVYAMGGTPLTALSIVGFPDDALPPEVLVEILRGAADKAREAGIAIVGGHTIKSEEPIFGLAVVGNVSRIACFPTTGLSPAMSHPDQALGLGIITTAAKNGEDKLGAIPTAVRVMTTLNRVAGEVIARVGAHAFTDVTGFGLLGHLRNIVAASNVGAHVYLDRVPVLPPAFEYVRAGIAPGGTHANHKFPRRLGDLRRRPHEGRATAAVRRANLGRPTRCRRRGSGSDHDRIFASGWGARRSGHWYDRVISATPDCCCPLWAAGALLRKEHHGSSAREQAGPGHGREPRHRCGHRQASAREGADVALTYVSKPDEANKTAEAAKALGVRALAIQADSADAEAVVAAVERTGREFGGIDILVNNAGIAVDRADRRLPPRGF